MAATPGKNKPAGGDPSCWIHELPGGWRLMAGKSDADNDRLSLRVARAEDWWFHVHGLPGSHVILQHPDGLEPDRELLKTAAAAAAWYSKARTAGSVTVSATKAKHVGKPRGAKAGSVTICREISLRVRPAIPQASPDNEPGGV